MNAHSLGKMLLIVPHPDDEVLMATGIMVQAARLHLPLHVCMVTNGDYGCKDHTIGHLRLRETLNALEYLGLSEEQVIFLGYADTGMSQEESFLSRLWAAESDAILPSLCSSVTYALPGKPTWHSRQFGVEAPYCRQSLETDLQALLQTLRPATILTTGLQDLHGDHSALYRFIQKAASGLERRPAIYQSIVHSLNGDDHWPLRDGVTEFSIPQGMEAYQAFRMALPEEMWDETFQQQRKLHALCCHVTAMKPDAIEFLSSFVKTDELFFVPKENAYA